MNKKQIYENIPLYSLFILTMISIIFLVTYSDQDTIVAQEVSIASIENFEIDTSQIVSIYNKRIDNLEDLTIGESTKVKEYTNNYKDNPRLDKSKKLTYSDVEALHYSYWIYKTYEGSEEPAQISAANKSIKNFFNLLRSLNEQNISMQ